MIQTKCGLHFDRKTFDWSEEDILRHPAKMQAIVGTMNPKHLEDACQAEKVK